MNRTQMASLARTRKYRPRIPHTYCPVCDAQPGQRCIGRNGEPSKHPHSRRGRPAESKMPDLREWWRSVRIYEGQFAQKRPADLVVP